MGLHREIQNMFIYINTSETNKKVYSHTHKVLKKSALMEKKRKNIIHLTTVYFLRILTTYFFLFRLPCPEKPNSIRIKTKIMLQTFKNTGCSGQTYIHADIVLGVLRQINRGILHFLFSSSPTRIRNKMNYPATEITLQKK